MLHSEPLSHAALDYAGLRHQNLEGTVLSTIINRKVKTLLEGTPPQKIERTLPRVSLYQALEKPGRHFILECKKASPTLGDFAHDFNLNRLLDCYNERASAISVLCEEHFFQGSINNLSYVKAHTELPVVCKDFILCKEQLDQAYAAGADAVLLMLSVLTEAKFTELYHYAHQLGLEVLCEVSTEAEALVARQLSVKIVGINNRNLKTLKVDLRQATALQHLFAAPTLVVSESGLSSHAQLKQLNPIRNYLVGSSLTGSKELYFAANSLLYGVNKVCGLTTSEAVKACIRSKVALGGLIFAQKSPRYVTIQHARQLIEAAKGKLSFVGVFVNEGLDTVCRIVRECQLSWVQLHGTENSAYIAELKSRVPELGVIKAVCPTNTEQMNLLAAYQELCDYLLLDSAAPGSGLSLNFNRIPAEIDRGKTLLAGGIGINNLQEALSLGFAGLDLNSRLERTQGIKDPDLIKEAFELINNF